MKDKIQKFITLSCWCLAISLIVRLIIGFSEVNQLISGTEWANLGYLLFGYIGEAIGASSFLMLIFNKWAWKWKFFQRIHGVPVLHLKYEGTFISDYDNVERDGTLTVEQSFLSVHVTFRTGESVSRSIMAEIETLHGVQYLYYTYQNDPHANIQERSEIHYGTAMLEIITPMHLEGDYYTGRKTRGHMIFMQ